MAFGRQTADRARSAVNTGWTRSRQRDISVLMHIPHSSASDDVEVTHDTGGVRVRKPAVRREPGPAAAHPHRFFGGTRTAGGAVPRRATRNTPRNDWLTGNGENHSGCVPGQAKTRER